MKPASLVGALLGGAVLVVGGVAWAKRRDATPGAESPHFVYLVQKGDTLSALALKFFGDAKQWTALRDEQGQSLDDKKPLLEGAKLRVPCAFTTVQKGESLAGVAKRTLGDAGRWRRIWEANKKAVPDPNKLGVGQRLAVPMEGRVITMPETTIRPSALGSELDLLDAEWVG